MRAFRNLKIILSALGIFAILAVAGFHLIQGWSWLDSLYMVVMTITTIGYKEVHELSRAGQVFNIAVMVVGVGLVFLSIGALTQGLLEFELGRFLGKRKMQRDIERLSSAIRSLRDRAGWFAALPPAASRCRTVRRDLSPTARSG